MSVKKCCVPKCSRTGEILHLFPNPVKDMDMFRTWIYAVGGDILSLDNDKIYKLRRICHAHFEPRYHTRSHRLAANAVPTLNLPGFSIVKTVKRKPMHDVTNKLHDEQQPPDTATASTSKVIVQNIVNTAASTVVEGVSVVKEKPVLDSTNKVLKPPAEQPPATATAASSTVEDNGIIAKESTDTADVLLFFDKLFDSLNGSYENSKKRSAKPLLCAVTPKSEHKQFWTEAIEVLKTMKFVNQSGKSGIVPSITNWIFSIQNMQLMVDKLFNEYGLTSLWMRHFNQDPLENFFGSIRSHGYRNVTPTCAGFENAFASLLINNISSMHSPGANCEQDSSKVFKSLGKIFFEKPAEITSRTDFQIDLDYLSDNIFINIKEKLKNPKILAQLQYVAGYTLKKTKKVFKTCITCNKDLISDKNSSYIILRERIANKRLLTYPSNNLIQCFSEMQDVVSYVIVNQVRIKNIKNYLKVIFAVVINYDFITCSKHKKDVILLLEDVTCNIFLYNWCKRTNDLLDGKSTDADKNDIVQMMACEYHKKRIKKQ